VAVETLSESVTCEEVGDTIVEGFCPDETADAEAAVVEVCSVLAAVADGLLVFALSTEDAETVGVTDSVVETPVDGTPVTGTEVRAVAEVPSDCVPAAELTMLPSETLDWCLLTGEDSTPPADCVSVTEAVGLTDSLVETPVDGAPVAVTESRVVVETPLDSVLPAELAMLASETLDCCLLTAEESVPLADCVLESEAVGLTDSVVDTPVDLNLERGLGMRKVEEEPSD